MKAYRLKFRSNEGKKLTVTLVEYEQFIEFLEYVRDNETLYKLIGIGVEK